MKAARSLRYALGFEEHLEDFQMAQVELLHILQTSMLNILMDEQNGFQAP